LTAHDLVWSSDEDSVILLCDAKLIKRLLGNLLSNAIKYSPDGGQIAVSIKAADENVSLKVSDQGVGIPPEDVETLFKLFQRASNVDDIKGHGLGLSIVKQVADAHDATISVDSTVGEGTTFTIVFPRHASDIHK